MESCDLKSIKLLGIFVQPSSVQRLSPTPHSPERERRFRPINFPTVDTSCITSRVDTGKSFVIIKVYFSCFFSRFETR